MTHTRTANLQGSVTVAAALFLAAIALRPQIVAIGPLLPELRADLQLSHSEGGLLATIPVMGMGFFSLFAARVNGRFSTDAVVTAALVGTAAFGIARTIAPSLALLFVGTVGVGATAGLAGVMLPVVVKERFARRPAVATGIYAAGIQLGAVGAAALAVPLANTLGGWRQSLFAMSAATLMLAAVWELTHRRTPSAGLPRPELTAAPRRPLLWLLVLAFGAQSALFYGMNTWLPSYLVSTTWTESAAASALALMNFAALAANLSVPHLADRVGSRRSYLLAAVAAVIFAIQGFLWAPAAGWAWSLIAGVGLGILFPIVLTLPLDLHHEPHEVVATTGIMLGGGYIMAAAAPVALGAMRDMTGGFDAVLVALTVICVLFAFVAAILSPTRLRREQLDIPAAP